MQQDNFSIIQKSNLREIPTIVINQCTIPQERKITKQNLYWIDSPSRGLSISRNLAIKNASADICILSDDDEVFEPNLEEIIAAGYQYFPQADIIVFNLRNHFNRLGKIARRLTKYDLLKVTSFQITFKLKSVRNKISFDPLLGSGTNNGSGEENKFLLDCFEAGLKIYFVPKIIATLHSTPSHWFVGFDKKYFYNRGKSTRYIYGFWFSNIYALYFLVAKRKQYISTISTFQATRSIFAGIWKNELKHHD